MSKKVILTTIIVVVVIFIGAIWIYMRNGNGSPQNSTSLSSLDTSASSTAGSDGRAIAVTFQCAGGKNIAATFYPENDTKVDLVLSDGRALSVPHAISGSGARYANADESFVFWNKGETAFIEENGTTTFSDCAIPVSPDAASSSAQ